jgi:hypothetical protein
MVLRPQDGRIGDTLCRRTSPLNRASVRVQARRGARAAAASGLHRQPQPAPGAGSPG